MDVGFFFQRLFFLLEASVMWLYCNVCVLQICCHLSSLSALWRAVTFVSCYTMWYCVAILLGNILFSCIFVPSCRKIVQFITKTLCLSVFLSTKTTSKHAILLFRANVKRKWFCWGRKGFYFLLYHSFKICIVFFLVIISHTKLTQKFWWNVTRHSNCMLLVLHVT